MYNKKKSLFWQSQIHLLIFKINLKYIFFSNYSKFHDHIRRYETINFSDNRYESQTKKFISLYTNLKNQGALNDEKIFEVALEQLRPHGEQQSTEILDDEMNESIDYGLTASFVKATKENQSNDQSSNDQSSNDQSIKDKKREGVIDVKSLF